jgi:hypothetical protein
MPAATARRGGRAVDCTGLENRRPFTGLVSSNLTLSAKYMEERTFDRDYSVRRPLHGDLVPGLIVKVAWTMFNESIEFP